MCDEDHPVEYNFIKNYSKTCTEENGIQSLCICGDIYSAKPSWVENRLPGNAYVVIYEKNPQEKNIKEHFEIDGYHLKLSSFINYSKDHFTCCIPDFDRGNLLLLEEMKKTETLLFQRLMMDIQT